MKTHPTVRLIAAAVAAFGLTGAIASFWACDDAFISFRYARNLLDGHGLVFNAGERVEGYTNFAWTVLAAAGMGLGADAVAFGNWVGTAFFGLTLWLLWRADGGIRDAACASRAALPVALIGASLHGHLQVFASCGLETSMFCFLVTLALVAVVRAERPAQFLGAGSAAILATMTRPDGAILYATAGTVVLLVARRQRSWLPVVAYAAPFAVLYLPYFAWKWSYYGYPLPNTFYAKSAADPYPSQGLVYVGIYFAKYWVLGLGAPILLALAWVRRATWSAPGWSAGRAPLVLLLFTTSYLAFVVWVGGDFMFGRFCTPVTPALFLALALVGSTAAIARRAGLQVALALAVGAGTLLTWPLPQLADGGDYRGIHEERDVYPPEHHERARRIALHLKELTAGLGARVLIQGGHAMVAYYAAFPVVIEGAGGLTDERLAHMELPPGERGMVGHEKHAFRDPAYLFERGVHFLVLPKGPRTGYPAYRFIDFGVADGLLFTYQRDLMQGLRERGAEFVDFERHLDEYIADLPNRPPQQVGLDYLVFRKFYFEHNDDPERERAFEEFLR